MLRVNKKKYIVTKNGFFSVRPENFCDDEHILVYPITMGSDIYNKFYFNYDMVIENVKSIELWNMGNPINIEHIDKSTCKNMVHIKINGVKMKMYEFRPVIPFMTGRSLWYGNRYIYLSLKSDCSIPMWFECLNIPNMAELYKGDIVCFENKWYCGDAFYKRIIFYAEWNEMELPVDIIKLIMSYLKKRVPLYTNYDGRRVSLSTLKIDKRGNYIYEEVSMS